MYVRNGGSYTRDIHKEWIRMKEILPFLGLSMANVVPKTNIIL